MWEYLHGRRLSRQQYGSPRRTVYLFSRNPWPVQTRKSSRPCNGPVFSLSWWRRRQLSRSHLSTRKWARHFRILGPSFPTYHICSTHPFFRLGVRRDRTPGWFPEKERAFGQAERHLEESTGLSASQIRKARSSRPPCLSLLR